ncbi:MAG TPA: hypothetical protein VHX88_07640 [Solirubrobacteraceae bacterium]|jgi:hypothetical protein|nr:hypothetical protein [Solirubrobacteraceae bacterium]
MSDCEPPLAPEGRERVRCGGCGFRWFGVIAAHGLSVLGACPRCGGELEFREHAGVPDEDELESRSELAGLQPWEVLGVPSAGGF